MTLIAKSEIRDVTIISEEQKREIMIFLQGAVYSWCKNRKDEWFAMRDLMGGDNYYWEGTPLYALFDKHINLGKTSEEAVIDAAKDSGWLLKRMIHEDKRNFYDKKEGLVKKYLWDGDANY